MAGILRMDYAALDECVSSHLEAADMAGEIDQERRDARLPHGSLGTLSQSDEIQEAFDQAYNDAGQSLRDIAKALRSTFRTRITDLCAQMDELGAEMGRTAEFLDDAAMEGELAETLVEDIIRELIEWAIIMLVVSAATSVITVGLSTAAGAAVAAAKAAHAASKIARPFGVSA